jgi:putative ATP-grasp target RiPP
MTRVLDPLSAQLPMADPIEPTIEPASALRPLIMRAAPVPTAIDVPTADQVDWDAELQLAVDSSTRRPALGHTNGSTATTTARDSSSADTDTDARDD